MFISSVRWGFTHHKNLEVVNFTINSRYIVVAEQDVKNPTLVRIVFHDNDSLVLQFKLAKVAEHFIQQISND